MILEDGNSIGSCDALDTVVSLSRCRDSTVHGLLASLSADLSEARVWPYI